MGNYFIDRYGAAPSTVGTPDPSAQYKGPKAAADLENAIANTQRIKTQSTGDTIANANAARTLRQNPVSNEDMAVINGMRGQLGNIDEALQYARDSAPIVDRFKPGPNRAEVVSSAIPEKDAGLLSLPGAALRRWATGVTDRDIADYQALQRYANFQVAQKQMEQKGPQTESDALRYMMTGISPDKLPSVNAKVIADTIFRGEIAKQKPDFYLKWANRNGALGALENGRTADQAWNAFVAGRTKDYNGRPAIRRLNGAPPTKNGAKQAASDRALINKYLRD